MELGHARYWAGDYPGALDDLNRAVALDPAAWWAYAFRGRVYAALGQALRAIAELSKAIDEGQQNDPLLYLWRAEAYLSLGGCREADADCTAGLALNPHDWRLWKCRGAARFLVAEAFRNLAGALGDFTQAIALSSQAEAYLGRGLVYRALRADNAAVSDFNQFVARHPGGPAAGARELASIVIDLTSPPVAVAA
jgi:tetratricopeptide (TPR) repeat protein